MLNKKYFFIIFMILFTLSFGKSKKEKMPEIKVETTYDNQIDDSIKINIKYKGEDLPKLLDYVFVKTLYTRVRQNPWTTSEEIYRAGFDTKYLVKEKIKLGSNIWYKVETPKGEGYIYGKSVELRTFRFPEMLGRIQDVEKFISEKNNEKVRLASTNSYLPNPYNKDMKRAKDKYGVSIDQNIVGVYEKENTELHIPDRSILSVEKINGNYAEVKVEGIKESPLKIQKKYLSYRPSIEKGFKKAVVVDVENQNLGVFEKVENDWVLISYIYAKTGIESELGFETPRGSYIVPMLKYEMGYRGIYGEDAGIAKYAIRFSGGGYLHGTPIEHDEESNEDFFLNQKETGLGTFKGTRKCIRNTVSHSKFLFDWIMGDTKRNENSNYQAPSENIIFIVI
ncbi:L,D-transpeptidase family protein [Fusobacterium sp.]|uniref:L,D-transpeptidase family protein n=3 Tax=Fusobacterium sp. TaxID=68766 RepID=UPI00260D01B5|nr:L,D-transpeptidase [Fusobacterium sp.]